MLRSFAFLFLVIALHVVIMSMLLRKNDVPYVPSLEAHYLQYVAIIPPVSLPLINSAAKVKKSSTPSIIHSAPTMSGDSMQRAEIDSAQPKLDWDRLKADAARYEVQRERSAIELEQEKNRRNRTLEAKLERGAEKAKRGDCRTAYAQTGLLAPLFITADLLRDKGCQF